MSIPTESQPPSPEGSGAGVEDVEQHGAAPASSQQTHFQQADSHQADSHQADSHQADSHQADSQQTGSHEELTGSDSAAASSGPHASALSPAVRPGEAGLAGSGDDEADQEGTAEGAAPPQDTAQASHAAPPGFAARGPQATPEASEDAETAPGHRPALHSTLEPEPGPAPAAFQETGTVAGDSPLAGSVEPPVEPGGGSPVGISEATPTRASDAPAEDTRTAHTVGSFEVAARPAGTAEPQAPTAEPEARHPDADHAASDHAASDHAASDHAASDHAASDHAASDHAPEFSSSSAGAQNAPEGGLSSEEGAESAVYQDFDRTWQRIEEAFEQKQSVNALVVDRVKGGLLVDIGVQGFVPASQVASGKIHDLEKFVGRTLTLRITDLDRERQRVVLSARQVLEEEHAKRKRETLDRLKPGWVTEGIVRRLTDFGAFVDIGGVDGLLHVTEMAWSRVKHPKEVVSPGDKIKVKVLKVSDDRKKISLGMRQLLPDPWNTIETHCKVGDMVTGRVVRVAQFGAFVQVRDGIEAILPNSEVSARKPRPEDLPQVGDTVQAKVIELRPDARRMTLSTRRIQEEEDRREYQQHVQQSQSGRRTTIGDMFGDILSDWNREKETPAESDTAGASSPDSDAEDAQ